MNIKKLESLERKSYRNAFIAISLFFILMGVLAWIIDYFKNHTSIDHSLLNIIGIPVALLTLVSVYYLHLRYRVKFLCEKCNQSLIVNGNLEKAKEIGACPNCFEKMEETEPGS